MEMEKSPVEKQVLKKVLKEALYARNIKSTYPGSGHESRFLSALY